MEEFWFGVAIGTQASGFIAGALTGDVVVCVILAATMTAGCLARLLEDA